MKFLHQDRTSSVSAAQTALSGFEADNVKNDRPRHPWISTKTSDTFTISLNSNATYPIEAFFVAGLMADSCTWVLKNNAGTTIDSGTLDVLIPIESDLAGNPNTGNQYYKNQTHLLRSFFVVVPTGITDNGSLVFTLSTSTNRGDKNTEGNAVAKWTRDSANKGRFLDSSDAAINIIDHGQIKIGSHLGLNTLASNTISNPDAVTVSSNTTISSNTTYEAPVTINSVTLTINSVTLTIDNYVLTISSDTYVAADLTINGGSVLQVNGGNDLIISFSGITTAQITAITGDGTASNGVTLDQDISSVNLSYVYNPLKISILRCGGVLEISNPRQLSQDIIDYSIRRPQTTGGYNYTNRGEGQNLSADLLLSTAQAQNLKDLLRAYRAKPIPVLYLHDMPSGFSEEKKPIFAYIKNQGGEILNRTHEQIKIKMTEVI